MNGFKRITVNTIINRYIIPNRIRVKLYRIIGIKAKDTVISSGCFFNSEFISIGDNCFINRFCQFYSAYDVNGQIDIGNKCDIGMNVVFCTITHEIGNSERRAGKHEYKPIKVGDGTWIGANSTILPGIKIGEGCVIAAGSVVSKNCEPNGLYAGSPARRIKDLDAQ